ncbi:MAG: transketolase C-terminal domain-containing protein [Candidatus Hadarchaeales archaeon]
MEKIFFEKEDFDKIKKAPGITLEEKLALIADMVRLNALNTVVCARSGHLGASFSAVEILVTLYHHLMKIDPENPKKSPRDIFVLSKGHAAAALYSTLASCGFFPTEKLARFRRLGGLEGHAEISASGVETNTGSLGMGISKAKGFSWADRKSSVFVLLGDGELQEGQNWEAIQSAVFWKLDNLYLLIDCNKVQTDMPVEEVLDISPLPSKLRAFGLTVATVNGHRIKDILRAFSKLKKVKGRPKAIVFNTIKGKGVSFMEHPRAIKKDGIYRWHDGVPFDREYLQAWEEIVERIKRRLAKYRVDISLPVFDAALGEKRPRPSGKSLVEAFSEILVELGREREDIVVLDADLAESCGLRKFQAAFPERFIEVGIAEQDMVSTAGGLALAGKLPIVNTYAAFLTSRANEQIFNNCSEGSKIIYVGHLAGLLPAKPGKSHQGLRDISVLKSIPNLLLCAPSFSPELKSILEFLVHEAAGPSYVRLEHALPRFEIPEPATYKISVGRGTVLAEGKDVVFIAYGPTMVGEALGAREILKKDGIEAKVIALPWLSRIDEKWLRTTVEDIPLTVCIENHFVKGGLGEEVIQILGNEVKIIGVDGFGTSGEVDEILNYFGLDSSSIAKRVRAWLGK